MCASCGCAAGPATSPGGAAGTRGEAPRTLSLEQRLLARNDRQAAANRADFAARGLYVANLMSSPGAGKTTVIEHLTRRLAGELALAVVEGDQQTSLDAERVRAAGASAVQINTGAGCHLDAAMVAGAVDRLDPPPGAVVLIENVGNLVCPALFDLGEQDRIVIMSVTEGADKPLKYPTMFHAATLVLLTKVDLLPHLDVDPAAFDDALRVTAHHAELLRCSATTGEGMAGLCDWLRRRSQRGAARSVGPG